MGSHQEREDDENNFSLNKPLIVHQEPVLDGCRKGLFGLNRDDFLVEAKKQILLAGPLLTVNVFTFFIQVISVMFVGHVGGELALSGASTATSFATVTGFSLLIGGGNALDTFCGQSYGAKQYEMLGVHLQRAILVLLLVSIPLAFIWANAEQILLILGQDPHISAEAGLFSRYMIPSIFAYAILQCQIRFLGSQNIVVPMMVTTGVTTLLHVLLCWVLVFRFGLASKGAALASGVSYWINVLLLALYIRFSPSCNSITWKGFSTKAFHDIPRFIRLAVPSAIMVCLEIWACEAMVLIAGLLPDPTLETSASSISLSTQTMVYMIPLGLGAAVSIRVSNELGAGRSQAALMAVRVGISMVAIECTSVAAIIIFGRKLWGYCFSNEERVVSYVAQMMLIIASTHFCDGFVGVLTGVARGCGWQRIGAYANLGAYFLIGIPLGIVLAFVSHVGAKGLWIGILVADFMQALILAIVTIRANWEKEAEKASVRVHNSSDPIHV